MSNFIHSLAFDIVGLGFAAIAGYQLIIGQTPGEALTVAALYLGVRSNRGTP